MVMISVTLLTRPCPATSSTQFVMKSTIARRSSSSEPYVPETHECHFWVGQTRGLNHHALRASLLCHSNGSLGDRSVVNLHRNTKVQKATQATAATTRKVTAILTLMSILLFQMDSELSALLGIYVCTGLMNSRRCRKSGKTPPRRILGPRVT